MWKSTAPEIQSCALCNGCCTSTWDQTTIQHCHLCFLVIYNKMDPAAAALVVHSGRGGNQFNAACPLWQQEHLGEASIASDPLAQALFLLCTFRAIPGTDATPVLLNR